jgi:cytosine/adenosine deaminase-related metal-dependent hydrolase
VAGSCAGVDVHYFTELLGLSKYGSGLAMQTLVEYPAGHNFTCHAAYSTSSALLQAVKKRAQITGQLYPIHVAESSDEIEFLQTGQGRFRIFLEERGVWDGSFAAPGAGAVTYLDQLGVLDARTLCVHAVHLNADEIELVAQKKAKVCLCPGSNRFLGVGRAQPEKMLAKGIRPCLGTDSLASNPELSMWREMAILGEEHPGIDPATVLAMATLHGAEAVGAMRQGRLEAGCSSRFLGVRYTGHQPLEFLVADLGAKEIIWL